MILHPLMERYIENPDVEQKFDPEFGWVLKPNFKKNGIEINSLGFRSSQEFNFETDFRKKVLLLGDSMVFGFGVFQKSIFSELLNREYKDVIFVNSGVNGYSTWQEYLVLKKYVHQIKPDLIILFYTQENDMFENPRQDRFHPGVVLMNNEPVYQQAKPENKVPLYQKSMAYRLLNQKVLYGKDFTYLFQKLDFGMRRENSNVWRIAQRILQKMTEIKNEEKIRFVIVDVPTRNQLRNPKMKRTRQNLLRKLSQEEGLLYYDLLNFYPKNFEPLFLPNDPHWNSNGHQFIADSLKEKILPEFEFK